MTTKVEKSIRVDVPVHTAYNQWTQFEEFPQFMGGISEVRQLDDRTIHWVAEIAGVKREWDARILEQVPDEKIAWAATEGATNAGAVYFSATGSDQTLVRLSLEYEPEGLVEKAGDKLDVVARQAESDLESFKAFIESRREPTGAWRGSVNEGNTSGTPDLQAARSSMGDSGKAGVSAKTAVAGAAAVAAGVAAASAVSGKSGSESTGEDVQEQDAATEVPVVETPDIAQTPATTDTSVTLTEGTSATTSTYPVSPDSPAATEAPVYPDDPDRAS